jgi:hypothetical protein
MSLPPFLRSGLTLSVWRLVTRPVARVGGALVLGGALLTAMVASTCPPPGLPSSQSYRLVLETESDSSCTYGSAWNDGDVVLPHDNRDGRTVTMTSRYDFVDGCTWEATEVLTPTPAGYDYEYTEHPVECRPGATHDGTACPRRGHVTVVPEQ